MQSNENRRQHIRVRPDFTGPVRVDMNGENLLDILPARDISEEGMGVFTPYNFDESSLNKEVSFVVTLPGPHALSFYAPGRIVHVEKKFFGVKFLALKQRDRRHLRRYIRHLHQEA